MTPEERTLLTSFLNELNAARGIQKDSEADEMIRQALGANPDASYVLVQHAIVADQSLHAAQARVAELERQVSSQSSSGGFLSSASPWGSRPQPSYAPPPPEDRPGFLSGGGGLGSFLRSAGTTAAGVAGGEMLFNGLSDLFGRQHGGGFGESQGFMNAPEENIVINDYGNDDADGDPRDW